MRIATAAPAADDGDDDKPGRRQRATEVLRRVLLDMATAKFGDRPVGARSRLSELSRREILRLVVRLGDVTSWEEFLNLV